MNKIKALLIVLLSFAVAFNCIGYAEITGNLVISGTATYTPPPKVINYLHVSSATVTSGTATVTYHDGSENAQEPAGIVFLEADLSSATRISISLTITNSAPNDYVYKDVPEVVMYDVTSNTQITAFTLSVEDGMTPESEATTQNPATAIGKNATDGTNVINTTLTLTASAAYQNKVYLEIKLPFGFADEDSKTEAENQATVSNAITALSNTLNNRNSSVSYSQLMAEMAGNNNYVGNVSEGSSAHSVVISNVFGDTLNSVSFDENGSTQECTVMLKRFNTDNDSDYERVIMYLTPDSDVVSATETGSFWWGGNNGQNSNVSILVYAVVFDVTTNDSGATVWVQHGDVYKGSCHPNVYEYSFMTGPDYCDSFNTDTWEADAATYTTGDGVQYNVSSGASIEQVINKYDSVA